MKISIISCLLVVLTTTVWTQVDQQNLSKYWEYRKRLLGENGQGGFVDVGIGPGMSLVASERAPEKDCATDWHIVNQGCTVVKGKGIMKWADATLYHGFYMAILALEYANLERAKQPTEAVAEELWYALEAVERLDMMAEVALGGEPKLNGFFLRDDVPADFFQKKQARKGRRFAKDELCMDCTSSDYSCGELDVQEGGFTSQDQVIGLYTGFMMIQKLVGDKRFKRNLPTFGEKAVANADRMAGFMLDNHWKLRNPVDGTPVPDKWGGNAIGMSYPIAFITNHLTEGKHRKGYLRRGALLLGLPIYDLLQLSIGFQQQTNVVLAFASAALLPKRGQRSLERRGRKHDVVVYPLIHAVLFDKEMKLLDKKVFEELISSAPMDGPCFESLDCASTDGWKSYDRWVHPRFKNGNPYGIKSESSGLDFMLLYNLYHYYYHKELPIYQVVRTK